jgi:ubiquinone biosynthesis protein COQ4
MSTTVSTETIKAPPIDFAKATRAVRALLADPDDLPQVFALLEAFSGGTLERLERRFAKSASGRRLLADQPDIVPLLADREALRRLPAGSLGRAYLDFMESENISAEGIRAAAENGMQHQRELGGNLGYVHARMRDTHDLWHAVTGYHGDVLGETALLGFLVAQTRNPGIAVLVAVGLFKTLGRPEATRLVLDGIRRGIRAAWLPDMDWEAMLAEPLESVRLRLGTGAPPVYTEVRSSDIRAAAAAA